MSEKRFFTVSFPVALSFDL